MAKHGDNGQLVIVAMSGRCAKQSATVEVEPSPSQGSPCAKEHSENLSPSVLIVSAYNSAVTGTGKLSGGRLA